MAKHHHSNNSSAFADELFECVCSFCGLALKGLNNPVVKTNMFYKVTVNSLEVKHEIVFS